MLSLGSSEYILPKMNFVYNVFLPYSLSALCAKVKVAQLENPAKSACS